MWCSDIYRLKISINLDNGFYIFDDDSALGKTYLASLLSKLCSFGEPVASYSYSDFKTGVSLEKLLEQDLKVILIDRYDRYEGYCIQSLAEKAKSCIVLVDLKYITDDFTDIDLAYEWCTMKLQEKFIEVVS